MLRGECRRHEAKGPERRRHLQHQPRFLLLHQHRLLHPLVYFQTSLEMVTTRPTWSPASRDGPAAPLEDAPKPISRADEIARQLAVKELAHGVDEEHEAKLETEREALRAELRVPEDGSG